MEVRSKDWRSSGLCEKHERKFLTGSKEGSKLDFTGIEKGVFNIIMELFNNMIVIISAVGIVLSLLLLLVGVVDLRRQGLVMT